ncbi:AraC family transcriptional regulator [Gloeocapsopsis sp. IPPAS B-1203]|nr:AraC family transcriptional regulator [Gloeocapsopsis sp. IPPAS B-1203]
MAIALSEQDWNDLWKQGKQNGSLICQSDGWETLEQGYLPYLGNVREWQMPLREGLCIGVYEYNTIDDIICISQNSGCIDSCLSFFVSGDVRTTLHGLTDCVDEVVGRNYLSCFPNVPETETWQAGQRLIRVQIALDPYSFFHGLMLEQLTQLPAEVREVAASGDIKPYYRSGITTPEMEVVLHQILHCPYSGLSKRMYLEGKALELLTLQFSQFVQSDRILKSSTLRPDDIERIHYAREILLARLHDPPSLIELARIVGINDHKLKIGFRHCFGTTVFGYLHHCRMERSRQYLKAGGMTVSEVAKAVGFVNRGYFAASFRRKFGVNPGDYLNQKQKTPASDRHYSFTSGNVQ